MKNIIDLFYTITGQEKEVEDTDGVFNE